MRYLSILYALFHDPRHYSIIGRIWSYFWFTVIFQLHLHYLIKHMRTLHIAFTSKTLRIKPGNDFKSNKKIRNSGPQAGQWDRAIPLLKQQTRFGIAIRIRTDPFGSSWRIHCALKWTPRENFPETKTKMPTDFQFLREKKALFLHKTLVPHR